MGPCTALEVRVSGVLVGRLDRERDGVVRFVPDADWVAGGMRPRLGYGLLLDPGVRSARAGLPAWFENLLPERGSALRQRVCRDLGLRDGQSVPLLRALGDVLPGAVEVRGEVEEGEEGEQGEQGEQGDDQDMRPGVLKVSLAGMQIKLSMVLSADRFALPARSDRGDWIVKFPGTAFPDLPDVEAATLRWAQQVGHPVPEIRTPPVESLDGLPPDLAQGPPRVFAIRRFDRGEDGARIHQEDFAQVFEIQPEHKYGHTGPFRTSYDGIGRLVLDACGPDQAHEFVRRLAFVFAAGNGDAHLKNWSFQWVAGAERPRLSPCYDLVADICWPGFGWEQMGGPSLGLAFGRRRSFRSLSRETLDLFAERSGIPDAREVFLAAIDHARVVYDELASEFPERMRRALRVHWDAVPLLRGCGPLR